MLDSIKNSILNLFKLFNGLFRFLSGLRSEVQEDTLLTWRKRIFTTIFLCTALMCPFAYIPNIKYSIQIGEWSSAIIYTLAVLIVITVTTVHSIPFKVRAWTGLLMYYGAGLTSLLALGPVGSGRIFLFAFALLASLLLGLRAGILALVLNISTFFSLGWLLSTDQLQWSHITIQASNKWAANGYTFFFLNTVVTVSLGVLVAALEKNLKKEQSLTRELKSSYKKLEKENSERKSAQKSLRKSEERFRIVSEIWF
jgi:signal transduction histidine kinase